jgi:hypothetical protein
MMIGCVFVSQPLLAQASGQTDVTIDFPPLIILFYYSQVDVTITTAALAGIVTGGAGDTAIDQGTVAATAFTDNLAIDTTTGFTSPGTVDLTLEEAWAVRAIGDSTGTGDIEVAVTLDTAILTNPATDTITINSVTTSENGLGVYGASTTFAAQGLGTAVLGDVRLNLDLTAANSSGLYSGGQFTITASAL